MAIAATAAQLGGTVISTVAGLRAGKTEQAAANMEADQLEMLAKEEYAAGQREALEVDRQTKQVLGRGRAIEAASGAGGQQTDNLFADVAIAGNYRRDIAMYVADQRRRGLISQAEVTRKAGRAALVASRMTAAGNLINGFGNAAMGIADWYQTYGGGAPVVQAPASTGYYYP